MAVVSYCWQKVPGSTEYPPGAGTVARLYIPESYQTDDDATPDADVSYCFDINPESNKYYVTFNRDAWDLYQSSIESGPVEIQSQQVDLIASTILVCAMCLAFCIGWLCHEMGAK